MLNETLKNNAPENAASGNSAANAWQNMAAAVQETTKNMNKYELGKRALRAAIVGLTALALAGPSFSKNSNKAPKEAPVSVEWAEPATTDNPWADSGAQPMGLTPDLPPNAVQK